MAAAKDRDYIFSKLVIDTSKNMAKNALTVSTWGNISARDPETGRIYVTPSGMDYKKSTPEDVIVFNEKGVRVKGLRKPTIEKDIHIDIYKARADINAVIHTHSTYTIAVGVAGIDLPAVTEEFAQTIGSVAPLAKYAIPGSPLLAQYVVEALGTEHYACLLPSHGAVCAAGEMAMALKQSQVIERAAEIYILANSLGKEIRYIPEEDVGHMFRFHHNQYGQGK